MIVASFMREEAFALCSQMGAEDAIQALADFLLLLFDLILDDFGEQVVGIDFGFVFARVVGVHQQSQ